MAKTYDAIMAQLAQELAQFTQSKAQDPELKTVASTFVADAQKVAAERPRSSMFAQVAPSYYDDDAEEAYSSPTFSSAASAA